MAPPARCEWYRERSHDGTLIVMGTREESENGEPEMGLDIGPGPGGARRTLGRQLKRHRELAGKGAADFVQGEVGSASKMYRIEAGKIPVRPLDVKEMCFIYNV